jgi:hypothetical protein
MTDQGTAGRSEEDSAIGMPSAFMQLQQQQSQHGSLKAGKHWDPPEGAAAARQECERISYPFS